MTEPFVLLDGGPSGISRLYSGILEVVAAYRLSDIGLALSRIDDSPHEWAGYLTYEAGLALEPRLAALAKASAQAAGPLLWFARFTTCELLTDSQVGAWLSSRSDGKAYLGVMQPEIDFRDYARAFAGIIGAIQAGDIYQANLTFPLGGSWHGNPFALYKALRATANAGHGALLHDGKSWTLSLSPELFFRKSGKIMSARPMKGTAPRGTTTERDRMLAYELSVSKKNRSENLMIVDLLRNDLARVARPGTVKVERLFAVETYPTVHQMTSTIEAEALPDAKPSDLLTALFPCGSITGAPKIRAMELIHDLELGPRGKYCGSIGRISGQGDIDFNVAIRTLELDTQTGRARMGVGSGVIAESQLEDEWQECLIKARFLSAITQTS